MPDTIKISGGLAMSHPSTGQITRATGMGFGWKVRLTMMRYAKGGASHIETTSPMNRIIVSLETIPPSTMSVLSKRKPTQHMSRLHPDELVQGDIDESPFHHTVAVETTWISSTRIVSRSMPAIRVMLARLSAFHFLDDIPARKNS